MMPRTKTWLFFLASFLSLMSSATSLVSYVDKNKLSVEETLKLSIEYAAQVSERPDLSPLNENFEVLQTSQSSSMQIINGQSASSTKWLVELAPRKTGVLVLPSIEFKGEKTNPITVSVSKEPTSKGESQELILTTSLDKSSAYVDEQILLTIRLQSSGSLKSGSLSDLKVDNAIIEKVGDQQNSVENIDGIRYQVIEVKYAIFAQQGATSITIPSVLFDGTIADSSSSFGSFDSFFGPRGKRVRKRSKEHTISIKPIPASFPKDAPWLVVNDLRLSQSWSVDPLSFEVGKPVTRTLSIEAEGTIASFLPKAKAPLIDGVKIYEDKQEPTNSLGGKGFSARLGVSQVFVPTTEGAINLPNEAIYWWDAKSDTLRQSRLDGHKVEVAASNIIPKSPKENNATLANTEGAMTKREQNPGGEPRTWFYLSLIFAALWVMTSGVFAFFLKRNKELPVTDRSENNTVSLSKAMAELKRASATKDPSQIKNAIVSYARIRFDDPSIRSLGQVSRHLAYETRPHLENLQKACYGSSDLDKFDAQLLVDALLLATTDKTNPKQSGVLPTLNPIKGISN